MRAAGAVVRGRRWAESLMADVCDIDRLTTAWDEDEQAPVAPYAPVHAAIPCAFVTPPATSRGLLTDEAVTPETPVIKVSVDTDGILPDDRVTVAGMGVVWVTHVPTRTNQVQRRLVCRWAK